MTMNNARTFYTFKTDPKTWTDSSFKFTDLLESSFSFSVWHDVEFADVLKIPSTSGPLSLESDSISCEGKDKHLPLQMDT